MQKNIVQCVKNCKVRDHFGTGAIALNYGQLQFLSIFQVMVKMLEYLQIQNKKRRT